jgi:hypothetical protein
MSKAKAAIRTVADESRTPPYLLHSQARCLDAAHALAQGLAGPTQEKQCVVGADAEEEDHDNGLDLRGDLRALFGGYPSQDAKCEEDGQRGAG